MLTLARTLLVALCLLPNLAVPALAATKPFVAKGPAQPSDAQIENTIRTKLAKSKIGADGFRFHVQHGIVTWEGTTNVAQHKGAATRMAHTAGAVGVNNRIEVSAAGKAKALGGLRKATVKGS